MTFKFDHVVIAVHDLNRAMDDYRALGFNVIYGGRHASNTTHNALIYFADGTYLELLAPTGEDAVSGTTDYRALLGEREGLIGYCLAGDNLTETVAGMRHRGGAINDPQSGGRARADGVVLKWQTATSPVNAYPTEAMTPFFISDETPRNLRVSDDPAVTTQANGVIGIAILSVLARDYKAEASRLIKLLGQMPKAVPSSSGQGNAVFTLGNARLWVIPPRDDEAEQQEILGSQSRAPYLLILRLKDDGIPQTFDVTRTHGVNLFAAN